MSVRKITLFAAAALLGANGWILAARGADQSVPERLYGDGVHAYFAGDSMRAFNSLTMAAQAGSRDPRVYYFRGLAELRLGREPDATADFEKGGALEATDASGYSISQSLERIQGSSRAMLEQYRENARSIAFQQQAKQQRAVAAEAPNRDSGAVLLRQDKAFSQNELTPPAAVPAAPIDSKATSVAKPAAEGDPFATGPAKTADATEKPADSGDPFGADAGKKPADAPAGKPAIVEKPAAVDKPAEDPLGDTKPAAPAETPATADKTIPAKPKTGDADPFGSGDAMPNDKPATTPPKTAPAKPVESNDPFGSDTTKPADKTPPVKGATDTAPIQKPATTDKTADAPAKAADASATSIKPTPGALKGIFHAFTGALPGNDKTAVGGPVISGVGKPTVPVNGPGPAKGPDADPFGAAPTTDPVKTTPVAPVTKEGSAQKPAPSNPFIDEPSPDKPAPPTEKGATDAKANDPFGVLKPEAAKPDAKGAMDKDAAPK